MADFDAMAAAEVAAPETTTETTEAIDQDQALADVAPEGEAPEGEEQQSDAELYEVEVAGEKRKVTLEDLKKGYMQEADYTRKNQELSAKNRAIDAKIKQIGAWARAAQDPNPQISIRALRNAGVDVDAIVGFEVDRQTRLAQMDPNERLRLEREQIMAEKREFEAQRQREREQSEAAKRTGYWAKQFQSWMPEAIKSAELPESDNVKQRIADRLRVERQRTRQPITRDSFVAAAKAVRAELEEAAKLYANSKNQPAQKPRPKLPPSPSSTSGTARDAQQRREINSRDDIHKLYGI